MDDQRLQLVIVALCGLGALAYLIRRYLPRLRAGCRSCNNCGKGGGCH